MENSWNFTTLTLFKQKPNRAFTVNLELMTPIVETVRSILCIDMRSELLIKKRLKKFFLATQGIGWISFCVINLKSTNSRARLIEYDDEDLKLIQHLERGGKGWIDLVEFNGRTLVRKSFIPKRMDRSQDLANEMDKFRNECIAFG
jgi:hypothetical protein